MTEPVDDDANRLREDFRREALASWTEYLQTGRHLTGEEVLGWLRTWGGEEEKPIPKAIRHDAPLTRQPETPTTLSAIVPAASNRSP